MILEDERLIHVDAGDARHWIDARAVESSWIHGDL